MTEPILKHDGGLKVVTFVAAQVHVEVVRVRPLEAREHAHVDFDDLGPMLRFLKYFRRKI
jgi:hypothetical protein